MHDNTYKDTFHKFERYYPVIAEKVSNWYVSGRNTIVVVLSDDSKLEYHSVLNTIRNIPSNSSDDYTEEEFQRDFSYNLLSKMADAGMDQVALSEMTGISQVSISRYLNRKSMPNIYNCKKIARALKCSLSELIR